MPLGDFKDIHKSGLGGRLYVNRENTFFENLDMGLSAGYWQFTVADSKKSDIDDSTMIPFAVTACYRLNLSSIFNIVPHISIGASYNSITYMVEPETYSGYGLDKEKKSESSIEPLLLGGLTFECNVTHRIFITAGGEYGMLIEKSGNMPLAAASAGAGIRF